MNTSSGSECSPAIQVDDLTVSYLRGTSLIDGVHNLSFAVAPGEILGIVGPNGAGKTSTISACTTRIRPRLGDVRICGHSVRTSPVYARANIGVVPQTFSLDSKLTVECNVYYHCRYFGMGRTEARKRVARSLEQFHLEEYAKADVASLSGGMAQRLKLARALSHRPLTLFLDEPTTGLDPVSRLYLWEAIRGLRSDGVATVITTHQLEEIERVCDNVLVLVGGERRAYGMPGELRREIGGTRRTIQLGIRGELPPAFVAAIDSLGLDARREGNTFRLRHPHVVKCVGQVMRLCELHGVDLDSLAVEAATLEEVFITLSEK